MLLSEVNKLSLMVLLLGALIVGSISQANSAEKKCTCFFKASGAGPGAFVRVDAQSKIDAEAKTRKYIKSVVGQDAEIQAIDCR